MKRTAPVRVMFVCLGNICRSPLAHGLFEQKVAKAGLGDYFEIASAGTGAWHVGQRPDSRMRGTARCHGLSLDTLRAHQFTPDDLSRHDHIFVMDRTNRADVLRLDRGGRHRSKVELFRTYDPAGHFSDVPDPYYGGRFEEVYRIVDRTCRVILERLVQRYGLPTAAADRTRV
ncbi:MAG: low molecular weight phosphotyrosine protein phosphatase [Bacteroidota bacterium]|nr:low molecular weight phosphotyrosine protein phosphatase [Bacteroidota bacterium]